MRANSDFVCYNRVSNTDKGDAEMNKQPEALRLADAMENKAIVGNATALELGAAAELRRLHQSEREGWRYANELEQDRKRLHALNAELLEALKLAEKHCPVDSHAEILARAAIAKAEGT